MRNLTLLTDLYQLTMMYGYWKRGMKNDLAVFDMFYRKPCETMNYSIMAGVEQLIDYINTLYFDEGAIAYLRSLRLFEEGFLDALRTFRFTGDIQAVPGGTMVFPGEPLVRVTAPIFEAQLIETTLLKHHQPPKR
jgi:nicotinate phosphoribosyltransferase